jgi:hypothetical protein
MPPNGTGALDLGASEHHTSCSRWGRPLGKTTAYEIAGLHLALSANQLVRAASSRGAADELQADVSNALDVAGAAAHCA